MQSVNPATGEVLERYDDHGPAEIERRIERAAETFRSYRKTSFAQRSGWMRKAGEILESEKAAFGRLMTLEMGKTLKSAIAGASASS